MDWVKTIAIVGSAVYGVEKMLKVFRLWRATAKDLRRPGLTIRNGEYLSLLETLGRIESRQDHTAISIRAVEMRVGNLEKRLSGS